MPTLGSRGGSRGTDQALGLVDNRRGRTHCELVDKNKLEYSTAIQVVVS
jgi:hypothetical protein